MGPVTKRLGFRAPTLTPVVGARIQREHRWLFGCNDWLLHEFSSLLIARVEHVSFSQSLSQTLHLGQNILNLGVRQLSLPAPHRHRRASILDEPIEQQERPGGQRNGEGGNKKICARSVLAAFTA